MPVLLLVVVLLMLSAAATMVAVAWRMARTARERESARVELLRTRAGAGMPAMPAPDSSNADWMTEFPSESTIFAERAESVAPLPRWVSLTAVGAAMALIVTLYVSLAGGAGAARAADPPIELIALQQQFGVTGFSVSGVVRVAPDSPAVHELTAVINLFDAQDRLLTSRTTPVERADLKSGQTSAFSLTFPDAPKTVARYRVGFRAAGHDTVAHVDRRAPGSIKAPTS